MSASASLDTPAVTIEPGSGADIALQVANPGNTVESYRFEVVGQCAPWAVVEPESVSLLPGTSATATLRLRPPRSPEVPAGETSFGVRVMPTDHPEQTVVPEGTVTVLPYTEVTAELVPRSTHGRLRARHRVAVDNRGNSPVTARLTVAAGSQRVRLGVAPAVLTIPVGQAGVARVTARAAARRWRGTPMTHPFQVVVTPESGEAVTTPGTVPVTLDGSFEQEVILPRWLPRAVVGAALLVAALAGLWYGLLRPAVRSTAREAADAAVTGTPPSPGGAGGGNGGSQPGGAGSGSGGDGSSPGSGGGPSPSAGSGGSGGGVPTSPGVPPGAVGGTPVSVRLEAVDAVGGGSATSGPYRVPAGQAFDLTDLVVQNPQGDAGSVVISSQNRSLLTLALENFRDQDYHFIAPIVVPSGGQVTMTVTCRQVGRPVGAPAPSRCVESLFLGGTLRPSP